MSNHNKKTSVGIIGLGGVAEVHILAYQQLESVQIVAGSDISQLRAEQMANKWHFKPYTNHLEMMEKENIDVAIVSVPCRYHAEIVNSIAKFKKPIIVEKPLANSVEEGKSMIQTCKKFNVPLGYGASYRWLPACIKAKEMINSNLLGEISSMMEFSISGNGKESFKDLGPHHYRLGTFGGSGMGLVDHGIHLIDLFHWFLNVPVSFVYGRGNYSGGDPNSEYAILSYSNGAVGHLIYDNTTYHSDIESEGIYGWGGAWRPDGSLNINGGWESHPGNIRIHGIRGALRIYHYANQLFYNNHEGMKPIPIKGIPMPGNFALQLESFLAAIKQQQQPPVPAEEGLIALQTLEAIYKSQTLNKPIQVDTTE